MLGNKVSPFLESGSNQWKGKVSCVEAVGKKGEGGKERRRHGHHPTPMVHVCVFQGAEPQAESGWGLKMFYFWLTFPNLGVFLVELTQWLQSALYDLLCELLKQTSVAPFASENKAILETAFGARMGQSLHPAFNATIFYSDQRSKMCNLPRLEEITHHSKLRITKAFYKHAWFPIIYWSYISKHQTF